ncbi:helicase-related protein [Blastococcus atacamensis]|uniref:helicase-related protein n=1 Tax=Blastococcus atacamensis TaxID=2070508 RepID=UPI000CEC6EDB|nr:helicase-related protein [Blastococcus atacamensis]
MTAELDLPDVRERFVGHLRGQYLGPQDGQDEVLRTRPDRHYLVGTLYPRAQTAVHHDGSKLGDEPLDDDLDEPIELANAWHPASAAVSFLHDAAALSCTVTAGRYERAETEEDGWRRTPMQADDVDLAPDAPTRALFDGRARLVSVWRRTADRWLVTVAVENTAVHDDADTPPPTEKCLFQVHVRCRTVDGVVHPYPSPDDLSDDPEEQELRLLYRARRAYGVGHGCSVNWTLSENGNVTEVETEMLPMTSVPATKGPELASPALSLRRLADASSSVEDLCTDLDAFVDAYKTWADERAAEIDTLPGHHHDAARRLVSRIRTAKDRMRAGVTLLRTDARALLAFRLANAAMREQMLQSAHVERLPGEFGRPLAPRPEQREPTWRPFQLGFLLLTLPSMTDDRHPDRETVDLIWFPTGGGKTEAYLGLAAYEMVRRRLDRGLAGGGTAVLTRYTLRLLTTQQFQRAATLICALERLRDDHPALDRTPPFSIGLWVGSGTTPNDYETAHKQAVDLKKAQTPVSPYQIQNCPWCGTPLFPEKRSKEAAYGVRTTRSTFELFCPNDECSFHDALPVQVVDEQIFDHPPTLLVATVDKLARLPWLEDAGSLLGLGNVPFDAPSLVIQDELHLLSGPLGTTVALYESAVQGLLGWNGKRPKVVASTATIRAADHQVRSLYGTVVALFPPSGLSADNSFFAVPDPTKPGRLYMGLMPQAHTQAFATVLASTALLQGPAQLELDGAAKDAYWTVVAYHNSLRELGRTVTIARDDVESMLLARSSPEHPSRRLKRDGVVELTSNVRPEQLPQILAQLERKADHAEAVDLLATTNMLSVGIDISRLGLMLMNGQPKTTSEYIQATSRVGRGKVPGLVVTLLRASKPRDRSHYEAFRAYHEALYRYVEPTSVTPWSLASRERALSAALVMMVRHGVGLRSNEDAGEFSADDPRVKAAVERIRAIASLADPDEAQRVTDELQRLVNEWDHRASEAVARGEKLRYRSPKGEALLKEFGERKDGWETMHSMRSVDRQVRVLAIGETAR